jgi:hypothetical protein
MWQRKNIRISTEIDYRPRVLTRILINVAGDNDDGERRVPPRRHYSRKVIARARARAQRNTTHAKAIIKRGLLTGFSGSPIVTAAGISLSLSLPPSHLSPLRHATRVDDLRVQETQPSRLLAAEIF